MKNPLLLFTLGLILLSCSAQHPEETSAQKTVDLETPIDFPTPTSNPIPPAQCPLKDPQLVPEFPFCDTSGDCWGGPYYQEVLDYLNKGGTFKNLNGKIIGHIIDLTGDGVYEFAWRDTYAVFVLGCKEGKFETILEVLPVQNGPVIEFIDDLNRNGIPELFLSFHERRDFHTLQILEWQENDFTSLIRIKNNQFVTDRLSTTGWEYNIQDTNQDQFQELVFINKPSRLPGTRLNELPWRYETITLGWDGRNYVIISKERKHW